MTAALQTLTHGGSGGDPFDPQYPSSIAMRGDVYVDALILNSVIHGGSGGVNPKGHTLSSTDYWTGYSVTEGQYINRLAFRSKEGVTVVAQDDQHGSWSGTSVDKNGIKIVAIGGRSARYLDQIVVTFVENYQPSTVLIAEKMAVYDCVNGHVEIISEETEQTDYLQAYENVSSHMSTFSVSASVTGDFCAKASADTNLTLVDSNVTKINQAIHQTISNMTKTTLKLGDDEARMLVGQISIMRDAEGQVWYHPTQQPKWAVKKRSEYGALVGFYDMSASTALVTGLKRVIDPATQFCKLAA